MLGDYGALAAVVTFGMAVLAASIGLFSRRFGEHAVAAAGVFQRNRAPPPLVA
ncbi:MAG: hypothetical protein WBE96_11765 [Pseudolabrys sp.]